MPDLDLSKAYSVRDFGAVGNGTHDDTAALQEALDVCSQSGGGTVRLDAGTYLSGTLHLRSQVNLHLERGAVLLGSDQADKYPVIAPTPYGNLPGQIQALLWADTLTDCAITGAGVIDGGAPGPLSSNDAVAVRFRPALVFMRSCRDVRIADVTLRDPSFWTLHLLRCEDVTVRGITIRANKKRINTDGIDPDGCRNVLIEDCDIATGDDSIVIKSTEGDVCEKITVRNCRLSSSCAALKLGTEAIGDIQDVTFEHCTIADSDTAMALYMKDGSTYRNIRFSNITAQATGAYPLLVDITPRDFKHPNAGRIIDVTFENLTVKVPCRPCTRTKPSITKRSRAFCTVSGEAPKRSMISNREGNCMPGASSPSIICSRNRFTSVFLRAGGRPNVVEGLGMAGFRIWLMIHVSLFVTH